MKIVPYDGTEATQFYVNHYLGNQQQHGGYLPYFEGYNTVQTGNGIWGDIFKSAVVPLLKTGAKAILPHAASFGKKVIGDVLVRRQPVKKTLKKRGLQELKRTGKTLGRKLAKKTKTDIFG